MEEYTAKRETDDESKGFALGCVDYIVKTISPPIVLARVQTHLDLTSEKKKVEKLLSETLLGSIKMMSDLISIVNPALFSQSSRTKKEQELFEAHQYAASDLLTNIPSLETVGQIVAKQAGKPPKSDIKNWDYVTLCSQILKVALAYNNLIMSGRSNNDAASMMLADLCVSLPV